MRNNKPKEILEHGSTTTSSKKSTEGSAEGIQTAAKKAAGDP
jgi:hypothetical protein